MTSPAVEAAPAATVVLIQENDGLEVLMVERANRGFFGGLMVFPGGGLEDMDESEAAIRVVLGEAVDQKYRSAALRELAEEVGVALTPDGPRPAPDFRDLEMLTSVEQAGMVLDGTCLTLISRWITPSYAPRRYDTWFYLAVLTEPVPIRLDERELVSHVWVRPEDALQRLESGEWRMFSPTIAHLRWLSKRSGADDARTSAQGSDGRTMIEPQLTDDGSLIPVSIPVIE